MTKAKATKRRPRRAVYVQQMTCCSKRSCGTCGGRKYAHGPYWYAYWWDRGPKSAYIGKKEPAGARRQRAEAAETSTTIDPFELLGVRRGCSEVELKAAWRKAAFAAHPDRTGDDGSLMTQINVAYQTARRMVW